MKTYRKLLAVLIAASMMLTMIPPAAFAQDVDDLDGEDIVIAEEFEDLDEFIIDDEYQSDDETLSDDEYLYDDEYQSDDETLSDDEYLIDDEEWMTEESALDTAIEEDVGDESESEAAEEDDNLIVDDDGESPAKKVVEIANGAFSQALVMEEDSGPVSIRGELVRNHEYDFLVRVPRTGGYTIRLKPDEGETLDLALEFVDPNNEDQTRFSIVGSDYVQTSVMTTGAYHLKVVYQNQQGPVEQTVSLILSSQEEWKADYNYYGQSTVDPGMAEYYRFTPMLTDSYQLRFFNTADQIQDSLNCELYDSDAKKLTAVGLSKQDEYCPMPYEYDLEAGRTYYVRMASTVTEQVCFDIGFFGIKYTSMVLRGEYGQYELNQGDKAALTFKPSETGIYLLHSRLNEAYTLHYEIIDETGTDLLGGYGNDNPINQGIELTAGVTYTILVKNNGYPEEVPVIVSMHKMEQVTLDASREPLFWEYAESGDKYPSYRIVAYFCPTTAAPLYTGNCTIRKDEILINDENQRLKFNGWQDSNGNVITGNNFMSVEAGSTLTPIWKEQIGIYLTTLGDVIDDRLTGEVLENGTFLYLDAGTTVGDLNRRFKPRGDAGHRFVGWADGSGHIAESALLKHADRCGAYYDDEECYTLDLDVAQTFRIDPLTEEDSSTSKKFIFTAPEDGYYAFTAEYFGSDDLLWVTLSLRDDLDDRSLMGQDSFVDGKVTQGGLLKADHSYAVSVLNKSGHDLTGEFRLIAEKKFYVNVDSQGGSIEMDGEEAGSKAQVMSAAHDIASLTSICKVTRGLTETFIGWATSPDDTEPLDVSCELEDGATYYALYKTVEVSDLPAFRTWNKVGDGYQTTVLYRYNVPGETTNPKPIVFLTRGDATIHMEILDGKEKLLYESDGYSLYQFLPTIAGETYYVRVKGSAEDLANAELCAAEMNAVTLEAEYPIFMGTADAVYGDTETSVTGYYIPNQLELIDNLLPFETGDYRLNQRDYVLDGWTTSPDGELLTKQEMNDLPENSHLYAKCANAIEIGLYNIEGEGTVLDENGNNCDVWNTVAEGTTIQQLNDRFSGVWDIEHVFAGWNTGPYTTEPLDPTSAVTRDSLYFATFKEREFTELKVGERVDATFAAGEEKWFKVTSDTDELYLVYVQAPDTDITLNVYDRSEKRIASGIRPEGESSETMAIPMFESERIYYVQVISDQAVNAVVGLDTQVPVKLDPNGGEIKSPEISETIPVEVWTGKNRVLAYLTKNFTLVPPTGHTFLGWANENNSHTLVDVSKVLPEAGKTYYAVYDGTHTYGSYVTTKAATALAAGSKYHVCSVCHYKQTVTIPKLTPVAKFNVTSLPMQTGQTCKKVTLTMAKDDYIKSAWKSSNTAIVKVSGAYGTTTANKVVTCTITAQAKTGTAYISVTLASGKVGKLPITVKSGKVVTTKVKLTAPKPTNSAGTAGAVTIVKNNSTTIKVTRVAPLTANDVLKYATSDKTVATVSAAGVVKGIKNGTAKITVKNSAGTTLATVNVTVKSSISLNATALTLQKKQVFKGLKATMQSGDYVTSWKSSDTAVFKVTGGVGATSGKAGTCTITAMSPAAASTYAYLTVTLHSGLSKKIKVTVQNAKIVTTALKLTAPKPLANTPTKGAVTVLKGKTYTIKVTRTPITTQDTLKYTSSNTAVATVSSAGVVKALKAGTTTITVTSGTKKVYVSVTVK